mgnify:CR=1 FL=1
MSGETRSEESTGEHASTGATAWESEAHGDEMSGRRGIAGWHEEQRIQGAATEVQEEGIETSITGGEGGAHGSSPRVGWTRRDTSETEVG